MPRSYYNDNDPQSAAWLRELVRQGHLPAGDVDDRSILDIQPSDVVGYAQVHFFAGIGGWPYALHLAGWPEDRPVWTGSPPCQPFSVAGQGRGRDDERHLAPHFLELVTACRPPVLFGEQVASAAVFGKVAGGAGKCAQAEPDWAWIDDVSAHLEEAHYAVGALDLPAAGVGAPHLRQRCFFGAYDLRPAAGSLEPATGIGRQQRWPEPGGRGAGSGCGAGHVVDTGRQRDEPRRGSGDMVRPSEGEQGQAQKRKRRRDAGPDTGATHRMAHADGREPGQAGGLQRGGEHGQQPDDGGAGSRAHADGAGRRQAGCHPGGNREADAGWEGDRDSDGSTHDVGSRLDAAPRPGPTNGFWRAADWLGCTDGKWRPIEPGTFPLAARIPGRVGLLRGYGNAIVPQVAAQFIVAFEASRKELHPCTN